MAKGDTKTNQYLDVAANGSRADLPSETCCETRSQTLIRGVAERIMDVEDELERLENNPDVADIVATYADLQAYPTSQLTDKDVIRVLQDETHDGDSTYYRWSTSSQTWTYIGESKQYTNFVGTDGTSAGASGLVPAPAVTDADKFLKSDGTWAEASGGSSINVVQATGTSTTDVMSQNAVTSMVFADPGTDRKIQIGKSSSAAANFTIALGGYATASNQGNIAVGSSAKASNSNSIAIGTMANATGWESISLGSPSASDPQNYGASGDASIAIGSHSKATATGSVALGRSSRASVAGEINIGSTQKEYGYNSSNYRLISGVYDPQSAHDAATKGYVDGLVGDVASALNAINNGGNS